MIANRYLGTHGYANILYIILSMRQMLGYFKFLLPGIYQRTSVRVEKVVGGLRAWLTPQHQQRRKRTLGWGGNISAIGPMHTYAERIFLVPDAHPEQLWDIYKVLCTLLCFTV